MSDPRTALVAAGYDAMADTSEEWSSRVVELGCGNGTEETHALAARFELTGVDLSAEQLRRARSRVPAASFVEGDLLNHVPRELLTGLLGRVRAWLRPGGLFLATLGASDLDHWILARR